MSLPNFPCFSSFKSYSFVCLFNWCPSKALYIALQFNHQASNFHTQYKILGSLSTMDHSSKSRLLALPAELLSIIVAGLERGQEVLNLARSCRILWFSLDHREIYKKDAKYQLAHANKFSCVSTMGVILHYIACFGSTLLRQ